MFFNADGWLSELFLIVNSISVGVVVPKNIFILEQNYLPTDALFSIIITSIQGAICRHQHHGVIWILHFMNLEVLAINYSSNSISISYILTIIGSMYGVKLTHILWLLAPARSHWKLHHRPNKKYKLLPLDLYFLAHFMGREHYNNRSEWSALPTQPYPHPRLPNLRAPLLPPPFPPLPPPPRVPIKDNHQIIGVYKPLWQFDTIYQEHIAQSERRNHGSIGEWKLCILPLFGIFLYFMTEKNRIFELLFPINDRILLPYVFGGVYGVE